MTLPESLMKAAKIIGESPDMAPVEKLETIVLMTHGFGLWDQQPTLDPTSMAIPDSQWGDICEILMHLSNGDEIARVNLGLDWMNIGPSGYTA